MKTETTERIFELTIYGAAKPAGSKRAFTPKGWNRAVIVDANKNAQPWKQEVAAAARAAFTGQPLKGPLGASFTFYRARPAAHFGTGRNKGILKDSAPKYCPTKPDALKLARAIEDALSGSVYVDDAQICVEQLEKKFGIDPRVEIRIWQLEPWRLEPEQPA